MRSLRTAFTLALAALALPAAVLAQTPMAAPLNPGRPPYVRPPYTPKPARPTPPGHRAPGYRPGSSGQSYPVLIDASVMNRYLATPRPKATPTHTPARKPNNGQDQFESHSSTDANE